MTVLLVATTGGHLAQLRDLADRLPVGVAGASARLWVTHENTQSSSLLAGEDVVFVPYIGVKDLPGVARATRHARALRKARNITTVVSTGSGIAVGYLPYLAAHGVEAHYIESAARVLGPSLTGRILSRTPGVHVYAQYRSLARNGWAYGGCVFDGFEHHNSSDSVALAPIQRVVVTLGTAAEFPFRRMLERLAPILRAGGLLEKEQGCPVEVLWQTGGTPTNGLGITACDWLPASELDSAMRAADVVIGHAGVGSALAALKAGRAPVLVPREVAFGEIGDPHQEQVARDLAGMGLAVNAPVEHLTVALIRGAAGGRVGRATDPRPFALAEPAIRRITTARRSA
jgi:UDP-N-acetylglucosamine--N-acetylmuramyl-(pentapeptide) pyrophosphoryl-undecaprenol N-acetylglucosamine transferase